MPPSAATPVVTSTVRLADFAQLAKPRITLMVVITTAGGLWLAGRTGGEASLAQVICTLVGTALIVAGANALNMVLEHDIDGKMERTKNRPLPSGRMAHRTALSFGVATSVLAVPILAIGVNTLTALLAVLANLSYVLAYTPLKQRSHLALWVGAVPGAIPPLLGWTAATGKVQAGGLVLFGIMFLWQIPHFHAITLFRKRDYARAGLVVMPNVTGDHAVRHSIVRHLLALLGVSVLLVPLGVAHLPYLVVATVLGVAFFVSGLVGLRKNAGPRWAHRLFAMSLVYVVMIFLGLVADALVV